jgi:hypothetical protein
MDDGSVNAVRCDEGSNWRRKIPADAARPGSIQSSSQTRMCHASKEHRGTGITHDLFHIPTPSSWFAGWHALKSLKP